MNDSNVSTKINKSEEIRKYLLSASPDKQMPKDVRNALAEKGITVSNAFVSIVKSKLYNKNKNKVKTKPKNIKKSKSNDLDALILAKNYLRSFGGDFSLAKKNLEIVSKLFS